jgi:phycocyanobilin:ferredoxin oxidoreductase
MSTIFNKLKAHAAELEAILAARAFCLPSEITSEWYTKNFSSAWVRRANLDVIDVSESKKLYMMHLCIFPHTYDAAPIYGFDIIAGTNKITGAFLDFSPTGDPEHPLCKWFQEFVEPTSWAKPRELPEWARNIFSNRMVAAGNINTDFELSVLLEISKKSLVYYLDNISKYRPALKYEEMVEANNFTDKQNYYCQQQKCNPHTPRVLKTLGFNDEQVHEYIHKELFPEIHV